MLQILKQFKNNQKALFHQTFETRPTNALQLTPKFYGKL